VVAYTGEAVDHDHHPLAGPQVGVEAVGQCALQQCPFELATRSGVELGSAAGAASGAQGVTAAVLPGVVPAVGVLAGGAEPVGDLGLAGAVFEHAGGAQSSAFHGLKSRRWPLRGWEPQRRLPTPLTIGLPPRLLPRATTPAWTPLFARAAAVVTDNGTLAAHVSLVAREYGIPAVVATGDATTRLDEGQIVTVDGGAGTVQPSQ
jgi:hypothetical protein